MRCVAESRKRCVVGHGSFSVKQRRRRVGNFLPVCNGYGVVYKLVNFLAVYRLFTVQTKFVTDCAGNFVETNAIVIVYLKVIVRDKVILYRVNGLS